MSRSGRKRNDYTRVLDAQRFDSDLCGEDEMWAHQFLWGCGIATPRGLITKVRYLKNDEERKARAALVRVLRSDRPLSQKLRRYLAELFDEDSKVTTRRIVLRSRRQNSSNLGAVSQVAYYVAEREEQGEKKEAVIEMACKQFGISRKTVFQYLATASKLYKQK
jgi:hypothetical protein